MSHTVEFPNFPTSELPAIPSDWADISWHLDACHSFRTPDGLQVFTDRAEPSERENPEIYRFLIVDAEGRTLAEFDDWADVLQYIATPDGEVPFPDAARAAVLASYRTFRADGYQAWHALERARQALGCLPVETLTEASARRYAARMVDGVAVSAELQESDGFPMWIVRVDRASAPELIEVAVWLESNGRLYGEW